MGRINFSYHHVSYDDFFDHDGRGIVGYLVQVPWFDNADIDDASFPKRQALLDSIPPQLYGSKCTS